MARQKNGPNGPFYGKCGSVVGSSWRGVDYLRGLPKRRTTPPSENEAANRTRFGFTQTWLNHVGAFPSIGFANFSPTKTWQNMMMSWNSKNAVTGEAPNFRIDYSKVLLSDGPLQEATNPSVKVTAEGEFILSWETIYRRKAKQTDELLFIAICPLSLDSFFSAGQSNRDNGNFKATIPEFLKGCNVEVFMAFCSRDRKIASRSQYLGNLEVPS
ncbi:DUF6266 family protein [Desertivirga arenae]|uniref:DUF6266 family protein n=1 Tax=Desertivirga arenae TaxID=2810309 RepID=UPI001A9589BB|nr:DUF6266 family protein [Pedobacter sp. SYSU D00823]